ncbi:MAG: hypothetical protein OEM32_04555 [Acidimicrobiia bacterium]|nr:hypothetical protein [Acidimicrobiia bacterium]
MPDRILPDKRDRDRELLTQLKVKRWKSQSWEKKIARTLVTQIEGGEPLSSAQARLAREILA